MNESTLTGEPVVKKSTRPEDFDKEATYPTNHCCAARQWLTATA